MKKLFYLTIIILIGTTVTVSGKMKLQLSSDVYKGTNESFGDHNYVTNLKLELPSEITTPGGMMDIDKGMLMLGFLADISFPFGDENEGFKHIAGTG